ncbi:MAG: penicillin-binding protein 2 [Rhodospirillales bacterium]|nr:penicillin-binding protein 2 [Rhodospirillales bacterium]HJO71808.1 penicillin-binding protein 2 [Rhodospirillales bacterium]
MTSRQPPCPAPTASPAIRPVRLEGIRKLALETGRNRLLVTGALFALVFMLVGGRLIHLAVLERGDEPQLARSAVVQPTVAGRADIIDRNGVILATSLPTASLFANPREILDRHAAADKLVSVLPDLDRDEVVAKLGSPSGFVWLRRNLTPTQQYAVNRLGIPGLRFHRAERRVYPHGRQAAHVLGFTDVDGRGIAGAERYFNTLLQSGSGNLQLSIDIRIQTILREELSVAVAEFDAIAGAAVVLDANTGDVVALMSLPDFDPNNPAAFSGQTRFNQVTKGVYELGSIFKVFTAAMALDSGTVTLEDGYDTSKPIRIARFTINDYHGKKRWLSVPEILVYSSNIGAAKMALDVGTQMQRAYLGRLGLLDASAIELPEVGAPLVPAPWRDINTMTISYGHGIAVSPLQLAESVAAVVNGGVRRAATLLKQHADAPPAGRRVLSAKTSRQMRSLMRLVVRHGTGKKADAIGYRVGGKTGTAEKLRAERYDSRLLISSFVGAFPMDAPRYVVLCLLDEPKGQESTRGYATGGWVAAPVVRRLVRRIAPLAGIAPAQSEESPSPDPPLFVPASGKPAKLRGQRVVAN